MEIPTLWNVVFRNYAMAVAMKDGELAESTREKIIEMLGLIWRILDIKLSYLNGWNVTCEILRPGPAGSSSSILQFHPLKFAADKTFKEIQDIINNSSSRNVRGLLVCLRERMRETVKFFEGLSRIQNAPFQTFCEIMKPQIINSQDKFSKWEEVMKTSTNFDHDLRSKQIMEIFRDSISPKVFSDIDAETERCNGVLKALPTAFGGVFAD